MCWMSARSKNALHKGRVHVLDERPDERHFFARVFEDEPRVVGLTPEAIRRHHLQTIERGKLAANEL